MSEVGGWSDRFTGAVEIGRGAFGVVYRAREVALGREVAVKVLSTMVEGSALERFEREGLAMSALSGHPNVVPIYSTGVTEAGRPFLVMPYLSKGSLRAKVTTGPLPWADVARIGVRLAGALEYAHEAGVLHRDVKPDNVLISDFDEPLLADFGIARLAGGFETVSRSVTASIVYAAPEVLDGQTPTIAADVYSLGASLFHLLAGKPAFAGSDDEGLAAVYVRISRAPVPDLAEFGVPAPIAAVISTAMAKDPAARPVSAERFGRALQNAQRAAGVPMTAMVLSTPVERVGDDRVHNSVPAAAAPAHHPTGAAYGGGDPMNPDSPLSTVEGKTGSTLRRRSSGEQRSDRRRSPIVLTVVVALALAGVAVAVLVHRSSGTGSSASSTTSASTAVDTPLVLTDQPVNLPLHIAAGMSAQMPISATAGERVFGTVTLSAKPATPIPIALMFNDSPAESNTITDRNIDIDPVTLDSTGTWILQIGPVRTVVDGVVRLALTPPDVAERVVIGGAVDVQLLHTRQRAVVHFAGKAAQRVVAAWTWEGAGPLSTSLQLLAPDGATVLASWNATVTGESPPVTLGTDGDYTIVATIDGDGTGAATLMVRPG